jgi:diadenosine tetraphosphate (Ap4A) HIT family hydrolase
MADAWTLWENEQFSVWTTANPHLPPEEGFHVLVGPKAPPAHAWEDPALTGAAFELTARVCQVMERLKMAPWFNLQANGNWGLFPGTTPHFHIHIYARRPGGATWTQPVQLPKAPDQFGFAPLTESERSKLAAALTESLG